MSFLVCFGSPLVDITTRVDEVFLKKYKIKKDLANVGIDVGIFEEIKSFPCKFEVGGSITNTVMVCQKSLKNTAESVCYMGAIGNDEFGELIREELSKINVKFLYETLNFPTGKCLVLLNDSNRALVTNLGASKLLSEGFIEKNYDVLLGAKCFYLSAFLFEIPNELASKIINFAGKHQKILVFNLGAPFLCEKHSGKIKDVFKNVEVLIGNQKEFVSLSNSLSISTPTSKIETILSNFFKLDLLKPTAVTIATNGPEPIAWANFTRVSESKVFEFENSNDLDTNGAGDAFAGGFLAHFTSENEIEDCIRKGIDSSRSYIENKSRIRN